MTIEHRMSDMLPNKQQEHFLYVQGFGFQKDNDIDVVLCNVLFFRCLQ